MYIEEIYFLLRKNTYWYSNGISTESFIKIPTQQ